MQHDPTCAAANKSPSSTRTKETPQVLRQLNALFEESAATPQQFPDIIRSYRDRVDLGIVGGGDGRLNDK
jgi:hypothetical protein